MNHPDLLRTRDEEYLDKSLKWPFILSVVAWVILIGGIWWGFHA